MSQFCQSFITPPCQGTYTPISPVREANGGSRCGVAPSSGVPSPVEEVEEDEESHDWWTKYFASIDTMIEVTRKLIKLMMTGQLLILLDLKLQVLGL